MSRRLYNVCYNFVAKIQLPLSLHCLITSTSVRNMHGAIQNVYVMTVLSPRMARTSDGASVGDYIRILCCYDT